MPLAQPLSLEGHHLQDQVVEQSEGVEHLEGVESAPLLQVSAPSGLGPECVACFRNHQLVAQPNCHQQPCWLSCLPASSEPMRHELHLPICLVQSAWCVPEMTPNSWL